MSSGSSKLLTNIDKHRLIITVGGSFENVGIAPIIKRMLTGPFQHFNIDLGLKPADTLCPLKIGDELFIDAPDAEVNKDLTFGLDIALREPGIIEGKPLMKTVQQFADLISQIVPKFKPLLT